MADLLVFDLETQYLAQEVGGWDYIDRMRLSVGVSYSGTDRQFRIYTEPEVVALVARQWPHDPVEPVDALIEALLQADLIVGYNVLRFDYTVLRRYAQLPVEQLPTVDLLDYLYRRLGFRVSLESVAAATLGTSKMADGIQAVRWWRERNLTPLIRYCRYDVELTRDLYTFGRERGFVCYYDRMGRIQKVPVRW